MNLAIMRLTSMETRSNSAKKMISWKIRSLLRCCWKRGRTTSTRWNC